MFPFRRLRSWNKNFFSPLICDNDKTVFWDLVAEPCRETKTYQYVLQNWPVRSTPMYTWSEHSNLASTSGVHNTMWIVTDNGHSRKQQSTKEKNFSQSLLLWYVHGVHIDYLSNDRCSINDKNRMEEFQEGWVGNSSKYDGGWAKRCSETVLLKLFCFQVAEIFFGIFFCLIVSLLCL